MPRIVAEKPAMLRIIACNVSYSFLYWGKKRHELYQRQEEIRWHLQKN